MSVTVRIPTPIRQYTEQTAEVVLDGQTVGEVLESFRTRFPDAGARFFSANSKTSRFVNLYLNDEDIRFLNDLETPVSDKDTLSIVLAIAGGSEPGDAALPACARRGATDFHFEDSRIDRSIAHEAARRRIDHRAPCQWISRE